MEGKLKIFIGAAPGVGKTYTMLREAQSLRERGTDVVIGYVDDHGRPETTAQLKGLEIIPRKLVPLHGRLFEELDTAAIIQRKPQVVIVDELAHTNVPGSQFPKRFMDVEFLLHHGIDVLTAVNVQHIEGIHEEAEEITGIKVRELIPSSFVKRADQIEVIDVTPETLRQRLRDGSIYEADKVRQALDHFFRKSNLSALRELALREVADNVDERLQQSIERKNIPGPIGARETILVCVNYIQRSEKLIEKGNRIAERMKADLKVLTILDEPVERLQPKEKERLETIRTIADSFEADIITEHRNDRKIGEIILEVAERSGATQIVIGQPRRGSAFKKWWIETPVQYLLRHLKYIDVRIVGWRE